MYVLATFSFQFLLLDWLDESLSEDRFDVTRTKLMVKPVYQLEDFLKGRSNPECYSVFFDYFAPLIEKKSIYKSKLKTATEDAGLLSISSEAFGLLVLENHWNRWIDLFQKSGGKVVRGKNLKIVSNVQPKYTRGGLQNGRDTSIGVGKGWSMEGICRFNILLHQVRNDREKHPDFIKSWLASKQKKGKLSGPTPGFASPEGYACWTLSGNEMEGTTDVSNQKKMEQIQSLCAKNGIQVYSPYKENDQSVSLQQDNQQEQSQTTKTSNDTPVVKPPKKKRSKHGKSKPRQNLRSNSDAKKRRRKVRAVAV